MTRAPTASFDNGEADAGSGTADKGEFVFEVEIHD
jgi:hypothetical protein